MTVTSYPKNDFPQRYLMALSFVSFSLVIWLLDRAADIPYRNTISLFLLMVALLIMVDQTTHVNIRDQTLTREWRFLNRIRLFTRSQPLATVKSISVRSWDDGDSFIRKPNILVGFQKANGSFIMVTSFSSKKINPQSYSEASPEALQLAQELSTLTHLPVQTKPMSK